MAKIEKVLYLDTDLDATLIALLTPYYERKRGNDIAIQLMKLGAPLLFGAPAPALVQQPLFHAAPAPAPHAAPKSSAPVHKQGDKTAEEVQQELIDKALRDFD